MKLKRLLPITALVAVSPVVTLVTSCSKDDIDVDIGNVVSASNMKAYVISSSVNVKKDRWYDVDIDFEDFQGTGASTFREWNQIDTWWVGVCQKNGEEYSPINNANFLGVSLRVNDLTLSETDFNVEDNQLQITSSYSLSKSTFWDVDIEIHTKINKSFDNVYFVLFCHQQS